MSLRSVDSRVPSASKSAIPAAPGIHGASGPANLNSFYQESRLILVPFRLGITRAYAASPPPE